MSLVDKSEIIFQFGPIIWFTTLLIINLTGYLLSKWQKWDFIEEFSKISVKDVFECDLCLIETEKSNDDLDDNESEKLIYSKRYHYVNKNCNNIEINIKKLKNVYFFHSNFTILFLGYLFIKIVLTIQVLSTTCITGYKCMDNKFNDVCKNHTQNSSSNFMTPIVCEKYGIESFDSFIVNIGVFTGILKFIFEINKYVFKVSVNSTLKLSRLLATRVKGKYLLFIPFLLITIVIAFVVLSLVKVPGQNIVYSDEYYNVKLISCASILFLTIYAGCSTANYLFVSEEVKNKLYLVYHCSVDPQHQAYGTQNQINE
jgi:hypothetical protein